MDYLSLRGPFEAMRQRQAQLYEKELSPIEREAGLCVFDVAAEAAEAVKQGRTDVAMRAISLSTGMGKSTSAYAFIAAATLSCPDFSAAYVVPTAMLAEQAQEGIEELLGPNSTVLWTAYHRHIRRDESTALKALGHVPTRLEDKGTLPDARIVIVTHKTLQDEMQSGKDIGVRTFQGRPRSIVFIDEHPDLVEIISAIPSDVQSLHDMLVSVKQYPEALPVLSGVVAKMSALMQSTEGQTYLPVELVSREDIDTLATLTLTALAGHFGGHMSEADRAREAATYFRIVTFLRAAADRRVFFSRIEKAFHSYQLDFDASYGGYVLLDATADITNLVGLNSRVRSSAVPQVNYVNLQVHHIQHPKEYKNVSKVIESGKAAKEYAVWMKDVVLANTAPGDEVLVVTHTKMIDHERIGDSSHPDHAQSWCGRNVALLNWGAGVGLNKFKHKTHVFTFGEFFPKRFNTIGKTHGWAGLPLTEEGLKLATGRRKAGDDYVPSGPYQRPYEGELLRWQKQLAMRGAARLIDSEGRCHPMKLFTSMDRVRLVENLPRMFPGARPPLPAKSPTGRPDATKAGSKRDKLAGLLMGGDQPRYGADQVHALTGIPQGLLKREYESDTVSQIAKAFGWKLVRARDLGLPGRMTYLVKSTDLASDGPTHQVETQGPLKGVTIETALI